LHINALPCSCPSMSFSLWAPTRFTSPHLQIIFFIANTWKLLRLFSCSNWGRICSPK
jgi:hypothetical protein